LSASTAPAAGGGGWPPLHPSIRRAVNSSGSGQRRGRPVERHEWKANRPPGPSTEAGHAAVITGLRPKRIAEGRPIRGVTGKKPLFFWGAQGGGRQPARRPRARITVKLGQQARASSGKGTMLFAQPIVEAG